MRRAALLALVCLVPLGALGVLASPPASEADPAKGSEIVPLRVEITLSRSDGPRKLDSRSYVMWVNVGDGAATLKTGVEVPVAVTTFQSAREGANPAPATSYQYRNVGVNLKCGARALVDGRYSLELDFEQSSTEGRRVPPDMPSFRTAGGHFKLVLRDGQSGEAAVVTDPATGESLRVETALRVLD